MQCLFSVLSLVTFLIYVDSRSTPAKYLNFVTPCGRDPACLRDAIQSQLPGFVQGSQQIGTEVLDPFQVKQLDLDLSGNLKIQFHDGYAKGLRKCHVDSASIVEDVFNIQYHCNLTIRGKYRSMGQLLMFHINGDGEAVIKCRDLKVHTQARLSSSVGADGQEHLEFLDVQNNHSFEDGQVHYHLTNIFKGNPQLSTAILNFMNSNWRMVAEEFGKPIVDFGINAVVRNIKKLFATLPLSYVTGYGYEY